MLVEETERVVRKRGAGDDGERDNVAWTSGTIGPYRKREVGTDGVMKMQDVVESEKTKAVDAKRKGAELPVGQETRTRECGSPAVDGYAHVEPPCLGEFNHE